MENNLPSTWEKAALEGLASYVIGGDWGKETPERGFERVFVLRGTDYRNWETSRAKGSAVRYFKKQSVEKRQLLAGDIILEVSGGGPDQPVGRVVVIDDKALGSVPGKLSFSNFFRLIRIDSSINPFFVRYYLDHAYLRGDFNEMQSHTTNLRNLRVNEFLKKTDVPVPPRNEQDRSSQAGWVDGKNRSQPGKAGEDSKDLEKISTECGGGGREWEVDGGVEEQEKIHSIYC